MKGHGRPVTCVKFNKDGDLLVTSAKDMVPTLWRTNTGERLGTYNGHTGAVNSFDMYDDSSRLITGSADNTANLWDMEKGEILFTWRFKCPVRAVAISPTKKHVALVTSMLMKQVPEIHIMELHDDPAMMKDAAIMSMKGPEQTITHAVWTATGEEIIGGSEDGTVRKWELETGLQTHCVQEHKKAINDLQLSADGLQFLTASADTTAKLWDVQDMKVCDRKWVKKANVVSIGS